MPERSSCCKFSSQGLVFVRRQPNFYSRQPLGRSRLLQSVQKRAVYSPAPNVSFALSSGSRNALGLLLNASPAGSIFTPTLVCRVQFDGLADLNRTSHQRIDLDLKALDHLHLGIEAADRALVAVYSTSTSRATKAESLALQTRQPIDILRVIT